MELEKQRCEWGERSPLEVEYHDREWGVPSWDDRHLFEKLSLEGAQAGLSWSTILKKREGYRRAFAGFDAEQVARFTPKKIDKLVQNPEIVRHRGKIESVVQNARQVVRLRDEGTSLAEFLWQFVEGHPIVNRPRSMAEIAAQTPQSTAMSKALKQRGFRFVGPTTCYAFMQGVGMVDDHLVGCFRKGISPP